MFRIGFGYDVHRLAAGRALWLGGIRLDYHLGLEGHSDADVLIHAVCDALLGAVGLRDIGHHYPNTDPRWAGADSKLLLAQCYALVLAQGYRLGNIDCTLVAEAPKINPHVVAMQAAMASAMGHGVKGADISIKATTNEGIGFIGRQEGMAALAVALVLQGPS